MKRIPAASAVLLLGISAGMAQSTPPATSPATPPATTTSPPPSPRPGNSAVNNPGQAQPGAPVTGANSFTEGQARSRIESSGYSNVTNLRKDESGIWRGSAMKGGKQTTVSLDFKGNVVGE